MSQHEFICKHAGWDVSVVMGWDRPCQGYFLNVIFLDERDETSGEEHAYLSFHDPDLAGCNGFAKDPEVLVRKLHALGIAAPARLLDEVRRDGAENVGNRYEIYDGAGGR